MKTHTIAVLPGDGIGPELIVEARRVIALLAEEDGFKIETVDFPQSGQHYLRTGELLGDQAIQEIGACDSLLLGAIGDPALPPGLLERATILELSQRLDLWLCIRPAFLHDGAFSPLKDLERGEIDVVVLRDTTEGETTIPGGVFHAGTDFETTAQVIVHTRHGVDRALRAGFEMAMQRRNRFALVMQSQSLRTHRQWEDRLIAIAPEYPSVDWQALYPDNAALQIVTAPQQFDVIVSNLVIGGLFADLVGGLVGGMGLIGSVRWNPTTRFGMYEPAHGSAPKYAGLNVVSPMATLNAVQMMLHNLGEEQSAGRLKAAVDQALRTGRAGLSTRSGISTTASTDAVLEALADPQPAE